MQSPSITVKLNLLSLQSILDPLHFLKIGKSLITEDYKPTFVSDILISTDKYDWRGRGYLQLKLFIANFYSCKAEKFL